MGRCQWYCLDHTDKAGNDMNNLHKFQCEHDELLSMNDCIECLRRAVQDLEETNEWGGWEDLPYETGNQPKIIILPKYLTSE